MTRICGGGNGRGDEEDRDRGQLERKSNPLCITTTFDRVCTHLDRHTEQCCMRGARETAKSFAPGCRDIVASVSNIYSREREREKRREREEKERRERREREKREWGEGGTEYAHREQCSLQSNATFWSCIISDGHWSCIISEGNTQKSSFKSFHANKKSSNGSSQRLETRPVQGRPLKHNELITVRGVRVVCRFVPRRLHGRASVLCARSDSQTLGDQHASSPAAPRAAVTPTASA
jgi:hypothetical protein